jgi:hypothetical protein
LERDLADGTMPSGVLQMALDAETKEHTALQSATTVVCDALETQEVVQSGSSLQSHLTPSMVVCVNGCAMPSILA